MEKITNGFEFIIETLQKISDSGFNCEEWDISYDNPPKRNTVDAKKISKDGRIINIKIKTSFKKGRIKMDSIYEQGVKAVREQLLKDDNAKVDKDGIIEELVFIEESGEINKEVFNKLNKKEFKSND